MSTPVSPPALWASIPFVLMILAIAVGPFLKDNWWDRNNQYVVCVLGGLVVAAEIFVFRAPHYVWETFLEFFAFMSLIAALFVVTGGIVIHIRGAATPLRNGLLLLAGAVLANVMGTTGASMLLIRPFLRLNRNRLQPYLVVFFIFLVANVGGALTPIGDPPLFLGYLEGIPFFWPLAHLWPIWLFAISLLLTSFLVLDARNREGRNEATTEKGSVQLLGGFNLIFLAVILGAVFLPTPWRELTMIGAAVASYTLTPRAIHQEHDFTFHPIMEVATVFAGIFATMMPALAWLEGNAGHLGITTPGSFFWSAGSLSAFLDNAPTYLSFLATAMGYNRLDAPGLLAAAPHLVQAISVGAVFFGACTYIGNGPNFMVKCIADRSGVKCPSFLEYILCYTLPFLLPIFFLVWLIFFR